LGRGGQGKISKLRLPALERAYSEIPGSVVASEEGFDDISLGCQRVTPMRSRVSLLVLTLVADQAERLRTLSTISAAGRTQGTLRLPWSSAHTRGVFHHTEPISKVSRCFGAGSEGQRRICTHTLAFTSRAAVP
jgi:hypothetical protein